MRQATYTDWQAANQRYLSAELARLRHRLEAVPRDSESDEQLLAELSAAMPAPPAIDTLARAFGLSPFERELLLLCAGVEFDAGFAACVAAREPSHGRPTFGLALGALSGAHWSALAPAAPLRRWRLVEPVEADALTRGPLRIDERVLHYIAGVQHLDAWLAPIATPLDALTAMRPLPRSQHRSAERLANAWTASTSAESGDGEPAPVLVQITGVDRAAKRAIVAAACDRLGLAAHVMLAADVPASAREREELARLWEREAVLGGGILLIDADDLDRVEPGGSTALVRFLDRIASPVVVAIAERLPVRGCEFVVLHAEGPSVAEQCDAWIAALGPAAMQLNGQLDHIVGQFSLGTDDIRSAAREAQLADTGGVEDRAVAIWEACRERTRPRIDHLAQRIDTVATWDDLVLPRNQIQVLRDIAIHVRQRSRVYGDWGFARKGSRGLGIGALFAGPSGTGKTMAAEVLANELRLDLYRIDLSQIVNKYIGETEKNLGRLFDAAAGGGVILLFDEADALFGKRSEVKDSHDRYANIEVSYLLQRMETFDGLAILTTNLRSALDQAFLRRLRFAVTFPFPNAEQRADIWRRVFPPETPTEALDAERLARLSVTGGNIRSIALNAAFLAADAGEPVRMAHLLQAARTEHAKLERPLPEAETRGWT